MKKLLEQFDRSKEFFDSVVNSNIEKYRKGNASVVITDKNGCPVCASVKIRQKSHEFKFGANLFMLDELETDEKNEKYKKHFAELFNMATLPFYWLDLEPEKGKTRYEKDSPKIYRRPSPDLCIEFCQAHGIEPREHALAYEHIFPDWLRNCSVEEIKVELERRYKEISSRYADKIPTIEVTNEMEWDEGKTKFYDENDYVLWCFKLAEKYFPNNKLCINEHTWLSWWDRCRTTDKYYSYIEANMLKGARIDAIGMQYHLFYQRDKIYEEARKLLDPVSLYNHLDLYSSLKKPIQITEITIPSYSWEEADEQVQAELLDKLYSLWFSHPSVEQIVYWNLVDGYAYVENATPDKIRESQGNMSLGENYFHGGLLRFDMTPKPAYFKLKELLLSRWHTEVEKSTNDEGRVDFRGFFGNYEVEITTENKTQIKELCLSSKTENDVTFVI